MSTEKISEIVDVDKVYSQIDGLIDRLDKATESVVKLSNALKASGVKANFATSIKEVAAAQDEQAKTTRQLSDAEKELKKIQDQIVQTQAKIVVSYSDEAQVLAENRDQLAKRNKALKDNLSANKVTADSLKGLERELRNLRNEYANLSKSERSSAGGKDLLNKIKGLDAETKSLRKSLGQSQANVGNYNGAFVALGSTFTKVSAAIGVGIFAIKQLYSTVITSITPFTQLSDSLADIRKTTGLTTDEVIEFNESLKNIDTRTSLSGLRDIAKVAGQIGIGKNDLLGFTESVDKLNVALGDEFTGGAEQVAKEMGTLRNILGDIKSDNISDDMLKIGNAVNELGASGFATGPVVTDFANRIGGIGVPLGLTSGQILGLSATLQELNVSTERGGTAVSKILLKLTSETQKFAKVAGVDVQEFEQLVNTDLYGAFLKVTEGVNKSGGAATQLSGILDDMGIEGAGAVEIFAKLGANTTLLSDKVKLASTSLKNQNSILSEFSVKNETLAAKIDKLGKVFQNAFITKGVAQGIGALVDKMYELVKPTKDVADAFDEQLDNVVKLQKDIVPLLTRYDELATKTNRSASENAELKGIIDEVIAVMPGAATKFNEYGEAVEISTGRVRDFIEVEKDRLRIVNQAAIEEYTKRLETTKNIVKVIEGDIRAIEKGTFEIVETTTSQFGIATINRRKATQEEIAATQASYKKLLGEIAGIESEISRLSGDTLQKEIETRRKAAEAAQAKSNAEIEAAKQAALAAEKESAAAAKAIESKKAYSEAIKEARKETADFYKELEKERPTNPLLTEMLLAPEKYQESLGKLRPINKKLYDDLLKNSEEYVEKEKELQEDLRQKWIDMAGQAVSTALDIRGSFYDKEKNQIQDQINASEEAKDREIKAAGDNADKIKVIEARRLAEKERLERKLKEIDIRKAKFERTAALIQIGVELAKTLATINLNAAANASKGPATGVLLAAYSYAQIPLAIASAGLQTAAVLAKPIPKYEKGTDFAIGGPSIVSEKGREVGITPDKKIFFTPDKQSVMDIPRGTKIIPNDIYRMILKAQLSGVSNYDNDSMQLKKMESMFKGLQNTSNSEIAKSLRNQPQITFNWTEQGMFKTVRNGYSWQKYVNKNIN